ncbi:Smr/MutS family protein [uncultured Sphingomonas sp.]|uniref:Smr/MutS family protein n=1 Tax=uncultured Sphingomonas sp. TaxID=158754 RepID=UPI0035CAE949
MAGRRLGPDEAALWARVMAGVRPMRSPAGPPPVSPAAAGVPVPRPPRGSSAPPPVPLPVKAQSVPVARHAVATLDGGWDRRLARGIVEPDATVDLHGHTLAGAHAELDAALTRSIARRDRVILLVTGRPPRPDSQRPHARGAIRAAVGDWLLASRHAHAIAAVRGAHPRHGGVGALYLILRRIPARGF